jgi:hypothetical protein
MNMNTLSSTLTRALASAVVTAAALGGCAMTGCAGNKCGTKASVQKCGACKPKCGACGGKK